MQLSTEQQIQKTLIEGLIQTRIFSPLQKLIIEKLEYLLKHGETISSDFNKIGAFNFEIDSIVEMQYIGYPFYLFENKWQNNYDIDVRNPNAYQVLNEIKADFIKDQGITEQDLEVFFYNACYDVEMRNFSQCWQKAKANTHSDKMCYINIHDSRGFNCETAEPMKIEDFATSVAKQFKN